MDGKNIAVKRSNGKFDSLQIQKFNFKDFVPDPAIVMIAKKGSGKSWVVRAILNHFNDVPVGLIIAPTDRMSGFYGKFFPETYIHYSYKSETIQKVLARQQSIIEKADEKSKDGKKIDTRCFVIMDDCLADKGKWNKDQPIQELLFNGRHYKIIYILTMQYSLGVSPQLRNNFDYIFLLSEDFINNQKRIYDHYAGMFPSFDFFRSVFMQLTQEYGSMVIANRGARKTFFEKIFSYTAPNLDQQHLTFGCRQFNLFHRNNYDENWKKKNSAYDVNEFFMRKKLDKSRIIVEKVDENKKFRPDENKKNRSDEIKKFRSDENKKSRPNDKNTNYRKSESEYFEKNSYHDNRRPSRNQY